LIFDEFHPQEEQKMDAEEHGREERNAAARALRAKNGNFIYPDWPADALTLLQDPRLEGMAEKPGIRTVRVLQPSEIARQPSKYLQIKRSYLAQPGKDAAWVNEPRWSFLDAGRGLGFDAVHERPRIEQPKASPKKLFHFWEYAHFFVASPDTLELLRDVCPTAIASIPIEWVFSDNQALDGYEFMDVIAIHDVYDYRRSVVNVELRNGKMAPKLGYDRALREDIPASAHLFRDSFHRGDVFISRELAVQVARFARRELTFHDVQTHRDVELSAKRTPQSLKARLKKELWPTADDSLPLEERVRICVMPLLRSGRFAAAEALLTEWMRALPGTSFHAIADLQITTPPERCAEFSTQFCAKARSERPLKALYAEMNGFAVNPDLWFCDAFGYSFEGGEDGHDWLGEFSSSSDEHLVIAGLEPVQEAFANWMAAPQPHRQEVGTARWLAEALVITKFQGWLQRSLPYPEVVDCPFWATAHDFYEYLGKVAPYEQAEA
jgi:uncharacterized protein DUF1629